MRLYDFLGKTGRLERAYNSKKTYNPFSVTMRRYESAKFVIIFGVYILPHSTTFTEQKDYTGMLDL